VYDSFRDTAVTVQFSRPTVVAPTITIDCVVTDDFVGGDPIRDAVIEYTGGVDATDTEIVGLELGDNLYTDRVRTAVTSVTGVRGTTNITIDKTGDGTDDTTVDSDGLQRLVVSKTELVFLSSADIQLNVTSV